MKIRSDFVSNSSSSSFILADSEVFDVCNITKQDIFDALLDSYGKEDYDQFINENKIPPFYVYDMYDKNDHDEAIKEWSDVLKGWQASDCHLNKDKELEYGSQSESFNEIFEIFKNFYDFNLYDICSREDIDDLRCYEKNDGKITYVSAPDFIKDTLRDLYDRCGIIDNKTVLENNLSRFFVHFDDNEMFHGKTSVPGKNESKDELWSSDLKTESWTPTQEDIACHNEYVKQQNHLIDTSIYQTDSYSKDRIFEVIYNYLVKIGKVRSNCKAILDVYGKDQYCDWYTANGKAFTWRDLRDMCLTINCHEG